MANCAICGRPVEVGAVVHPECLPRWIPVTERMPKAGERVQICYTRKSIFDPKKKYRIITNAEYQDGKTLEEDIGFDISGMLNCEYDEEKDQFLVPEGWYEELTSTNGECFAVLDHDTEIVTHWRPLPALPDYVRGIEK